MSFPLHSAAALDLRAFRDHGVVSDDEYQNLSSSLMDKLNGMRVPVIRKGFELEPYTYDEYVSSANENYDKAHAPIADPEMGIEMNVVSLIYRAKFSMTMFPQFAREYFQIMQVDRLSFADVAIEVSEAGYSVAPTNQFRSLLLAGLQIEQEIKERYRKCSLSRSVGSDITVECRFFLPLNLDLTETEQMMVVIQVDLYPDE